MVALRVAVITRWLENMYQSETYRSGSWFWTSYFVNKLFWNLPFGETIQVDWPEISSYTDPNEQWRGWLEKEVGRQNRDWGWRTVPGNYKKVEIKFRNKLDASLFALTFA
jgi:hypothetical protein